MQNTPQTLDLKTLQKWLPPRKRSANKGDFGHVLIIGGDHGMAGAVRMAGEAAAHVGAGLVSIATRPEHCTSITANRPELMCYGVSTAPELKKLLLRATIIVVGPGLGQSAWAQEMLHTVLTHTPQIKIVDGDGLNLLAKQPQHRDDWILTPHPGEASRLLATNTETIQADRPAAAHTLQDRYGGVSVLKGAGTLVTGADKILKICQAGNPGMATGGMGDVLSGVIGGLCAQGLALQQAAELGVCLHATAGDLAAQVAGERGMLALDLMPYLRQLVNP